MPASSPASGVPSFAPPNVEHLMPVSPERMARQWAVDRLQPVRDGRAVAHFTILDARVSYNFV